MTQASNPFVLVGQIGRSHGIEGFFLSEIFRIIVRDSVRI